MKLVGHRASHPGVSVSPMKPASRLVQRAHRGIAAYNKCSLTYEAGKMACATQNLDLLAASNLLSHLRSRQDGLCNLAACLVVRARRESHLRSRQDGLCNGMQIICPDCSVINVIFERHYNLGMQAIVSELIVSHNA